MRTRQLGSFTVSAIGFGCMSLSHAYGSPPPAEEGAKVLHRALDAGYTFLDTAAVYGFGANETLLGQSVMSRRSEFVLASKCGIYRTDDGKREINGRPERIRQTCEESLARLKTDVIDLYYLHRWDKRVPIEESVGALGELVREGKVRSIGLSEVSAATLRRAHAEFPITALQSEYSLWTRNPEVATLDTCRTLGVAFVAFSPVGRGILTGRIRSNDFEKGDLRLFMPRFQGENFEKNLKLVEEMEAICRGAGCTPAQAALAWLLAKDEIIVPIPGTTKIPHLEEDAEADAVELSAETIGRLEALINPATVAGPRYNANTQPEIDTEELPEAA